MFATRLVRFLGRLALILVFMFALAGCGDDAGDTDAHMDEDEHAEEFPGRLMVLDSENYQLNVLDLETEQVVATFDDHDGFVEGMSANFRTSLKVTSDGRYGFVLQRPGHLALGDPLLAENRIHIVDSGLTVEEHGGHLDPVSGDPTLLPYQLGHGGGQTGLFNPVHFVTHHGHTAIFYDGINPYHSTSASDATEQNGRAVVYETSDFDGSTMAPMPIFERDVGNYSHGAVVAVDHDLFIVTLAEPNGGYPNGVETYRLVEHGDHFDVERAQDFSGRCGRLHGEAVWGPYVAFACREGQGLLVLTRVDGTDTFEATVVAYPPGDHVSGGLAAATLPVDPDWGHHDVIFMARYGSNEQNFLKITEHDIEQGLNANPEVLIVEAGNEERNRGFAFEPVDDNFPMGKGHFVVLTASGNLYIFDPNVDELVGQVMGIVDAECPDVGRPSLALAPGFAYVTDPANNKVYEVHLEDAEIERTFDLNAPTQLVVLGWFDYGEIEFAHARH